MRSSYSFSALTVDELLGAEDEVFVPADEPVAQEEQQAAQDQPEEATQPEEGNQQVQTPTTATLITGDSVNVWLNHRDGTITALFTYSKEQIEKAATVLNQYAALLPVGGKMHVMLAPRAPWNKFALHLDTESGWSSEVEAALQPLVSKNVVLHSAYDIFQEPILSGDYVYFRTDHHWTARGAYLAAESMLTSEGYQTVPLKDYSEKTIEGFSVRSICTTATQSSTIWRIRSRCFTRCFQRSPTACPTRIRKMSYP